MAKYKDQKDSMQYRLLKNRYRLLLKNSNDIGITEFVYDSILGYTTTESGVLEQLLKIDKNLKSAYELKEMYQKFNAMEESQKTKEELKLQLDDIIKAFLKSGLPEFIEKAGTLSNWKEEIINSFVWIEGRRLSNGPIEGKNNYIKKIIGNANGFKNFKRARNKIMYSQNKYEKYSGNEILIPIKNKG